MIDACQGKRVFLLYLIDTLSNHPDWIKDVLNACADGMFNSIKKKEESLADSNMVIRCSLYLVTHDKDIESKQRDIIRGIIRKYLEGLPSRDSLEQEAYDKIIGEA